MKWVTREGAKTDRVACPWLITRFIDADHVLSAELRLQFPLYDALYAYCRDDSP